MRLSAACRTVDTARFFSPPGERGEARRERERRAQQICDTCPVRKECAQFALSIGEEHGIWGGMTDQDRIAVLRRPRKRVARAGTAAATSQATNTAEAA